MTIATAPDRASRQVSARHATQPVPLHAPCPAPVLPRNPTIYAINALTWLRELRRRFDARLSLGTIPRSVWDELARWGVDAVWLRGVWTRSPAGVGLALEDTELTAGFRRTLPDFADADVVGSSSCVRAYEADDRLGGRAGLVVAREALAERGIGLILDFVANHVGPDHAWVASNPSYFIRGEPCELARSPADFLPAGGGVVARARGPYAAPWPDVVQLNVFDAGLRSAATDVLRDIAAQCDGVRCDGATLVLNDVFAQTWGSRPGAPPLTEYWADVIAGVKASYPRFLFIGKADWDREWDLQQLGFDYCYDERMYDRLAHDRADAVRAHLNAERVYQQRLARFIEDGGPPAAAAFGPARHRAVVVAAATQMGARIFHDGQCVGRRRRCSDFLIRRADESSDPALTAFYRRLLGALRLEPLRSGDWRLCECTGWAGNGSCENLVAWRWRGRRGWALVAVNLSGTPAQARVRIDGIDALGGREWVLRDLLSGARYRRDGDEMRDVGLYVDLPAWGYHLLVTDGAG